MQCLFFRGIERCQTTEDVPMSRGVPDTQMLQQQFFVFFQFDAIMRRVKVHFVFHQFSIFSEIHAIAMRTAKPRACASSHTFQPDRKKRNNSKKNNAIIILLQCRVLRQTRFSLTSLMSLRPFSWLPKRFSRAFRRACTLSEMRHKARPCQGQSSPSL